MSGDKKWSLNEFIVKKYVYLTRKHLEIVSNSPGVTTVCCEFPSAMTSYPLGEYTFSLEIQTSTLGKGLPTAPLFDEIIQTYHLKCELNEHYF